MYFYPFHTLQNPKSVYNVVREAREERDGMAGLENPVEELIVENKQMSEAFCNSLFLALSGGFQDAYTYFTRDGVFSNAQTGNVVLMSERFMNGEVKAGLHYLIPLTAFFLGVLLAERIQDKFRYAKRLHWRQGILLVEIILLFLVGFVPGNMNVLATTMVSLSLIHI